MSESTTSVGDPANGNADELKTLIKKAERALGKGKRHSPDEIEALRESLRDAIADGQSMMQNLTDTIRRQAARADDVIRANPYQTIGIAAALGLLSGFLLSRSCTSDR